MTHWRPDPRVRTQPQRGGDVELAGQGWKPWLCVAGPSQSPPFLGMDWALRVERAKNQASNLRGRVKFGPQGCVMAEHEQVQLLSSSALPFSRAQTPSLGLVVACYQTTSELPALKVWMKRPRPCRHVRRRRRRSLGLPPKIWSQPRRRNEKKFQAFAAP